MALPSPYDAWLTTLCGAPPPREVRATCGDCVMCGDDIPGGAFHPEAKCCTYVPRLPNYMMGRVIDDRDPAAADGRATVLARLASGVGVSPLGLEVTAADQAIYDQVLREDSFGRTDAVRCPHHLADGRCGVWRHRNGICATWFCRHEQGGLGQTFWDAVQLLFTEVERAMGYWVARRVRWPEGVTDTLAADQALFKGDWGPWSGREIDFYRACGREFSTLTWARVRREAGAGLRGLAEAVEDAFADLDAEPPHPMQQVAEYVKVAAVDGVDLLAYSATDPLRVPTAVVEALDDISGRRVPDVLAALRDRGIELEPELVRALHAFDVIRSDAP